MTLARPRIATTAWHLLPRPIRDWLRSKTGTQFMRFVPVSIAAVITSQVTLAIMIEVLHVSAGLSGVVASMAGAVISYVLSRWAWRRKGRPSVLKETIPFWAVSVGAWLVLGLVTHYSHIWAVSMHLHTLDRIALVQGSYLLANCVTFVARFVIFHYVLFANRGSAAAPGPLAGPGAPAGPEIPVQSAHAGQDASVPLVLAADRPAGPGPRR
jgi:putative flippase GtrA